MRSRLGGWVAAAALLLGACGTDGGSDATRAADAEPADRLRTDLVSVRDTLPPAPPAAGALTVVLAHPAGAGDPGLDAAAAALAQRPDIAVRIAVPAGTGDATMSGFPVAATGATAADAVAAAIDQAAGEVDLVVVGVTDGHGIGATSAEATAADRLDVPALVVGAEHADPPDHAAATMQLLEVLDLELATLLADPGVHRLAVPSCEHGILRGRHAARAGTPPGTDVRADCRSTEPPGRTEAEAFAVGYATLTPLP